MDIFLAYNDYACRVSFFGNEIEELSLFDRIRKHAGAGGGYRPYILPTCMRNA